MQKFVKILLKFDKKNDKNVTKKNIYGFCGGRGGRGPRWRRSPRR